MIDKILIDKSVLLIDKSVLQQTLAALEDADTYVHAADLEPAIDALRAALAASQPEDDGWLQSGGLLYRLTDERRVKNQMMQWAGIPVWVDGVVTTNPENWPLIDANDSTPKSPGEPFPVLATCTQDVQVGIGTAAP